MPRSLQRKFPWLEELYPGYFSLVMATGIVSIAASQANWHSLSSLLFYLNIFFYGLLWVLYVLRCLAFPNRVLKDFAHYTRGPAFLSIVAGTGILGGQFAVLADNLAIATALWILACVLWLGLLYGFLGLAISKADKPDLETGIDGTWLLGVVATQSLSALASLIAIGAGGFAPLLWFVALSLFLLGGLFYLILMALFAQRLLFLEITPSLLTPPYWISMGAVAITTLAGVQLAANATASSLLMELQPFIKGVTLSSWAVATWMIPLLILLGIWRHCRGCSLRYEPAFWSIVFPLGMYTTATFRLVDVFELSFLAGIPAGFAYVALAAWIATFAGMLHQVFTRSFPETKKS